MLRLGDYVRVLRPASRFIARPGRSPITQTLTAYERYVGRTVTISSMRTTEDGVVYALADTTAVWKKSDFEYLGSNLFGVAPEVTLGDSVIITDEIGQETVVIDCMWVECSDYGTSETDDIYVAGKLSNNDAICGILGQNAIPVTKQYTLF
mgnify:FL=1